MAHHLGSEAVVTHSAVKAAALSKNENSSGNQGMSGVWTKLRDGTLSAGAAARDRMNVKTLRLAITGLSGAGKTVFLVSVISNLLAMVRGAGGKKWDSLPRLREVLTNPQGQSRLLGIEIE